MGDFLNVCIKKIICNFNLTNITAYANMIGLRNDGILKNLCTF
jgi:hypothetical protein